MRLLLLLLILAAPAHAEIYKWVDENGKVHFGDRVPEQYKDQAGDVDVEVRQPTEEEIAEAEKRSAELKASRMRMQSTNRAQHGSGGYYPGANRKSSTAPASAYDRQMAEYRKSQACFASCAVTVHRVPITRRLPDGTTYQMPGGTRRDLSACGHCRNVKKPQK